MRNIVVNERVWDGVVGEVSMWPRYVDAPGRNGTCAPRIRNAFLRLVLLMLRVSPSGIKTFYVQLKRAKSASQMMQKY
jgi:hypothetical protein